MLWFHFLNHFDFESLCLILAVRKRRKRNAKRNPERNINNHLCIRKTHPPLGICIWEKGWGGGEGGGGVGLKAGWEFDISGC